MAISVDTDICLQSYCGVNFGANTIGIMFAVCCSVLQCVAVCCSVLQCVAVILWSQLWCKHNGHNVCSVLQCVAVCCSVLQCVAVCCSVLQSYCGVNFSTNTMRIMFAVMSSCHRRHHVCTNIVVSVCKWSYHSLLQTLYLQ